MKTNVAYNTLIKDLETLNIPFSEGKTSNMAYNWIPESPAYSNRGDFLIFMAYEDESSILEVDLGYIASLTDMYDAESNTYTEDVDYHTVLSKVLKFYYENIDKTP